MHVLTKERYNMLKSSSYSLWAGYTMVLQDSLLKTAIECWNMLKHVGNMLKPEIISINRPCPLRTPTCNGSGRQGEWRLLAQQCQVWGINKNQWISTETCWNYWWILIEEVDQRWLAGWFWIINGWQDRLIVIMTHDWKGQIVRINCDEWLIDGYGRS